MTKASALMRSYASFAPASTQFISRLSNQRSMPYSSSSRKHSEPTHPREGPLSRRHPSQLLSLFPSSKCTVRSGPFIQERNLHLTHAEEVDWRMRQKLIPIQVERLKSERLEEKAKLREMWALPSESVFAFLKMNDLFLPSKQFFSEAVPGN